MKSARSLTGMHSRGAINRGRGFLPREIYLVDVGLALLYLFDQFLQTFPFLGVHIHKLHSKVLSG